MTDYFKTPCNAGEPGAGAQLVDRTLPAVPVRQWVLSLPFELRRLAAFHAGVALQANATRRSRRHSLQ
jgi:hypothetical protein